MLNRQSGLPRLIEVARAGDSGVFRACSSALPDTRLLISRRTLLAGDISQLGGIPLTSPACTFVELAGTLELGALRRVFIEGCRLGQIRKSDLSYCLTRSRGRPGANRVRTTVSLWVPGMERTRSILEGLFLLGWAEADHRIPEVNARIGRSEVDFLWRRERVVVETDGRAYHSHEIARTRDSKKDAWLRAQGYVVLRFGYHEVDQAMAEVRVTVRAALDRNPTA